MNQDLEGLILAYEAFSSSRDVEALRKLQDFETKLADVMSRHPSVSRELLRKSIIKKHRLWALKQMQTPPSIPPMA